MKKKLLIVLGVLGCAQFIRPGRIAEPLDPSTDLLALTHPSTDVEHLLRVACYDCHSGQPRYPWYMNVTPVNWWIDHHITEAREHFDLSKWGKGSAEKRAHWAEEAMEMVSEGEMPLNSYTWTHADARLSDAERKALVEFFSGL